MKLNRLLCMLLSLLFLSICLLSGCGAISALANYTTDLLKEDFTSALSDTSGDYTGPSKPAVAAPSFDVPDAYRTVPFDEMQYIRPDAVEVTQQLASLSNDISVVADVMPLVEQADNLYADSHTMLILAMIHSSIDKSDAYWLDEYNSLSVASAGIDTAYNAFYRTLSESDFHTSLIEEHGDDFFEAMENAPIITDEKQKLLEREAELVAEYNEKLSTETIEYEGKPLTYADISIITDYNEHNAALSLWLNRYNPVLGSIYVELVQVRGELAELLGFDSYTDMAFDTSGNDYSPKMAEALIDDIITYLMPAYYELQDTGTLYQPDVELSYDEYVGMATEVLSDVDPRMGEVFTMMNEYGLLDIAAHPNKENGAYTTYIPNYDAPFIVATYTDDFTGISTITHEFGHFYNYYYTLNQFFESPDVSEIYSQALVLLFSNYFDEYFGEEAGYQMAHDTLSLAIDNIIEQSLYTAIELDVYALDPAEITVEKINQIAREQTTRFRNDDPDNVGLSDYDWVSVPHIYEMPFYTFAYATSLDVSLQIWAISLVDEQAAYDAYADLMDRKSSSELIKKTEAVGLKSPFAPGRMQAISAIVEQYLIDENWDGNQKEAA